MNLRTTFPMSIAAARARSCATTLAVFIWGASSFVSANQFVKLDYNLTLNNRSRDTVFIELFDDKPITRDNFMAYVNGDHYDGMLMHRLSRDFVMQGGAYYPQFQEEPSLPNPKWSLKSTSDVRVDLDDNPSTHNPTILNEYSVGTIRSNVKGTIAMARAPNVVNSASSQWFVNYKNNSFLDSIDGGFTVFAEVRGDGMVYFDALNSPPPVGTSEGMLIVDLNQDANNDGVRDHGPSDPFGGAVDDGVPLLFGVLNNLVVVQEAARVDYFGGTGSSKVFDIPSSGRTISERDVFFDAGMTFNSTASGQLGIGAGRTLGVREGISIPRPVRNRGTIAPGLLNGSITVFRFIQFSEGTLEIDIRGTTVDTHYDRLVSTDTATLAGKLEVNLLNEFVPLPGNSFTVLTASSISGSFSKYDLPNLDRFLWRVNQSSTSVVLNVIAGDYNNDGMIDAADYSVWRNAVGTNYASAYAGADGNGDMKVDAADYQIWKANYGMNDANNVGSGVGGLATVPEPTAGVLVAMAGVMLTLRRPRLSRRR